MSCKFQIWYVGQHKSETRFGSIGPFICTFVAIGAKQFLVGRISSKSYDIERSLKLGLLLNWTKYTKLSIRIRHFSYQIVNVSSWGDMKISVTYFSAFCQQDHMALRPGHIWVICRRIACHSMLYRSHHLKLRVSVLLQNVPELLSFRIEMPETKTANLILPPDLGYLKHHS